ncbi:PadR family transcriptional regulator [Arthrobacter sp. MYb23]|uniref:PadR family transcriptional regulator n=1 Tax=unclassified Arthrobacter TaxID=235627 RepID=UPI000CFC3157|nr:MULTISPECIES: PadR family transcriptional regulator [unclassified Arthrobacter]PRB44513.1 PadR family transcriptional regulator [Arthrobacter sp. MYb51]PRB98763.1 PadR family transcriptional regulator [Arthrobacter sp. MYb23]
MSRIQAQQDAQMVRSVLPLLILTLIAEEESYGYQLVERLDAMGLEVTTGLVYPVLSRLERDGLVSTRMVSSPNGPPRKYFALTTAGEQAKATAMEQWRLVASAVRNATEKDSAKP